MQRYSLIASFLLFSNPFINLPPHILIDPFYSDQVKHHKLHAPQGDDSDRLYATPEDVKHLVILEGENESGCGQSKDNKCATTTNKHHHRDDTSTRVAHTHLQSSVSSPDERLL